MTFAGDAPGSKPTKRMKVDHEEQVSQLFQGTVKHEPKYDLQTKKFVYKIVNEIKDSQNKASVDSIWKKYMTLPDRSATNKSNGQPFLEDKKQLIEILEELERDNLVMYHTEDGMVVLV